MLKKMLCLLIVMVGFSFGDTKYEIVKWVVDGDTIHTFQDKIRFSYIDAPESKYNSRARKAAIVCNGATLDQMIRAGKKSNKHLRTLVTAGDKVKVITNTTDKYGRVVGEVFLNGESLNEEMVRSGFAIPYYKYNISSSEKRRFDILVKNARTNQKGLWGSYPRVMKCLLEMYK